MADRDNEGDLPNAAGAGVCCTTGGTPVPPEERCAYCDEPRGPDEFDDGLRCKLCAEAEDEHCAAR